MDKKNCQRGNTDMQSLIEKNETGSSQKNHLQIYYRHKYIKTVIILEHNIGKYYVFSIRKKISLKRYKNH